MPPPSKRRKTTSAVAEVVFDDSARADYLTGFHKRKQARIKHAQEIAVKREKEEKRREREELKKKREENLQEHVKAVNESMRLFNGMEAGSEEDDGEDGEGDEWDGLDENAQAIGKHDEYIDEDQYATVTVEEVDITRDGFVTHADSEEEEEADKQSHAKGGEQEPEAEAKKGDKSDGKTKKRPWAKENPNKDGKRRKKSRNFKYETKEERKLNRTRDRAKRKAHAEARKAKR